MSDSNAEIGANVPKPERPDEGEQEEKQPVTPGFRDKARQKAEEIASRHRARKTARGRREYADTAVLRLNISGEPQADLEARRDRLVAIDHPTTQQQAELVATYFDLGDARSLGSARDITSRIIRDCSTNADMQRIAGILSVMQARQPGMKTDTRRMYCVSAEQYFKNALELDKNNSDAILFLYTSLARIIKRIEQLNGLSGNRRAPENVSKQRARLADALWFQNVMGFDKPLDSYPGIGSPPSPQGPEPAGGTPDNEAAPKPTWKLTYDPGAL